MWRAAGILGATVIGASALFSVSSATAHEHGRWGGLYIGAHVGGTFADFRVKGDDGAFDEAGNESYSLDASSVVGGVHIGYNHQAGRLVIGLEADVNFGDANKQILELADPDNIVRGKLNTHGTVMGRLGYDGGRFMPYVKAGLAWGRIDVLAGDIVDGTDLIDEVDAIRSSKTRVGWAVGAGFDYKMTENWIARLDYSYADLGSFNSTNAEGDVFKTEVDYHTVRVGISYKFGHAERYEALK